MVLYGFCEISCKRQCAHPFHLLGHAPLKQLYAKEVEFGIFKNIFSN